MRTIFIVELAMQRLCDDRLQKMVDCRLSHFADRIVSVSVLIT